MHTLAFNGGPCDGLQIPFPSRIPERVSMEFDLVRHQENLQFLVPDMPIFVKGAETLTAEYQFDGQGTFQFIGWSVKRIPPQPAID